jgi:hypothetical protein
MIDNYSRSFLQTFRAVIVDLFDSMKAQALFAIIVDVKDMPATSYRRI